MKNRRRFAWVLVTVGVGLFLAILFRGFIFANFVMPIALVLWLLWRVVLSGHQALYWGLLIMAAGCLALYRLAQVAAAAEEVFPPPALDTLSMSIGFWQTSIRSTSTDSVVPFTLKRSLVRLLVNIHASRNPDAKAFELFEALRLRQMPLPARVYAFLFPEEVAEAKPSWKRRLQQLAEKPGQWIRRWTGRDRVEYYQALEETLALMEGLLEIKHGDDSNPPQH